MTRFTLLNVAVLAFAASGCTGSPPAANSPEPADGRVRTLADTYVEAYFDRYPEQATYLGIAGRTHDRLTDNSLQALAQWEGREDEWLEVVKAISPSSIEAPPLRASHAILREAL